MKKRKAKLRIVCSVCEEAALAPRVISHDVGALVGMKSVMVHHVTALVCPNCGAVSVPGETLDAISFLLASSILQQSALDAVEVRYMRRLLGDTQEEFARSIGVDRATVNRWENSGIPITGTQAYAIRSHAFFRLRKQSPIVESAARAFLEPGPRRRPRRGGYEFEARDLRAAG